jgi:hypothetical protein
VFGGRLTFTLGVVTAVVLDMMSPGQLTDFNKLDGCGRLEIPVLVQIEYEQP